MDYRTLEEDGAHQGVYFILDESRNEPPLRRANLMINCIALLDYKSEAAAAISELAQMLVDVEQQVQRVVGMLLTAEIGEMAENTAYKFFCRHLENAPLKLKLELTGNAQAMGFLNQSSMEFHDAWLAASSAANSFERQFEHLLFRLRTRHWDETNAAAVASDQFQPKSKHRKSA